MFMVKSHDTSRIFEFLWRLHHMGIVATEDAFAIRFAQRQRVAYAVGDLIRYLCPSGFYLDPIAAILVEYGTIKVQQCINGRIDPHAAKYIIS